MPVNTVFKAATGNTYDELSNQGRQLYGGVPVGSAHHALAAERATGRIGFVPTQIGGVMLELLEALGLSKANTATDTKNDIKANALGGLVGFLPEQYRQPVREWVGSQFARPNQEAVVDALRNVR